MFVLALVLGSRWRESVGIKDWVWGGEGSKDRSLSMTINVGIYGATWLLTEWFALFVTHLVHSSLKGKTGREDLVLCTLY